MRRPPALPALLYGLACCASASASPVRAETLSSFSGRVTLAAGLAPDGVKGKLKLDLDRNRRLASVETLSARVAGDGSYSLAYDLDPKDVNLEPLGFVSRVIADYQARGFESLLDDGPLPVISSFEGGGYGTVVMTATRPEMGHDAALPPWLAARSDLTPSSPSSSPSRVAVNGSRARESASRHWPPPRNARAPPRRNARPTSPRPKNHR